MTRKLGRPPGTTAVESDALLQARKALGLTQVEFAAQLGLSSSALQRLERLGRLPSNHAVMGKLRTLVKRAETQSGEKITL